ncbi:MAG: hypothetical protein LBL39_07370, partial [Planctomycetaceae bacterium]|nr:hypothetical protein [Planctomycetaceae bacterium]
MLSFTPSPKVRRIISLLYGGGASECIFVGGFVRDILLGLSSKDVDIEVYGLTYKEILRILRHHFNVNLVGQSFGTIKVDNEIDISIPRKESKSGVGHKGFDVSCDPNLDLYSAFSRRDFTINAIGIRMDNSVYDPFGGVQDIDRKILRAPTESFCDDPLRVLRGMQFAARFGFKMEPKTVEYCKRVSDEFVTLSVERVWGEWLKWGVKGVMPSLGLFLLQETEWVQHFPEIAKLINVCSSRFKIRKAEHGSATTWSDCSRAKPTAHTGSGISLRILQAAAELYVTCNATDKAIKILQILVAQNNIKQTVYLMQLAELQIKIGDKDAAAKTINRLLESGAADATVATSCAELLFNLGRIKDAIDLLRRGSRSKPNDLLLQKMLIEYLAKDG